MRRWIRGLIGASGEELTHANLRKLDLHQDREFASVRKDISDLRLRVMVLERETKFTRQDEHRNVELREG